MKVIDNFLSSYQFKIIESVMMGAEFPWYFNEGIIKESDEHYQFTNQFFYYEDDKDQYQASSLFSILEPSIELLGLTNSSGKLYRIKANLNPRTVFHRKGGWHIDFINDPPFKTAVYYVNTNNGWTEFKKGGRVKSVANRMVIFDSNLEHQGVTCTDEKRRVVINFNYDV